MQLVIKIDWIPISDTFSDPSGILAFVMTLSGFHVTRYISSIQPKQLDMNVVLVMQLLVTLPVIEAIWRHVSSITNKNSKLSGKLVWQQFFLHKLADIHLPPPSDGLSALSWSPDSQNLLVASWDGVSTMKGSQDNNSNGIDLWPTYLSQMKTVSSNSRHFQPFNLNHPSPTQNLLYSLSNLDRLIRLFLSNSLFRRIR